MANSLKNKTEVEEIHFQRMGPTLGENRDAEKTNSIEDAATKKNVASILDSSRSVKALLHYSI